MSILIISGIEGARNCADAVQKQLDMKVEIAQGSRAALPALRARQFTVVVLDETLAECDPAVAEVIWQRSGLAIPMQINFALAGVARIIREIRAALYRREQEQKVALVAAKADIHTELKDTVTGLLLQSQLALSDGSVPPHLIPRLRLVVDLAAALRQQLAPPGPVPGEPAASSPHVRV